MLSLLSAAVTLRAGWWFLQFPLLCLVMACPSRTPGYHAEAQCTSCTAITRYLHMGESLSLSDLQYDLFICSCSVLSTVFCDNLSDRNHINSALLTCKRYEINKFADLSIQKCNETYFSVMVMIYCTWEYIDWSLIISLKLVKKYCLKLNHRTFDPNLFDSLVK